MVRALLTPAACVGVTVIPAKCLDSGPPSRSRHVVAHVFVGFSNDPLPLLLHELVREFRVRVILPIRHESQFRLRNVYACQVSHVTGPSKGRLRSWRDWLQCLLEGQSLTSAIPDALQGSH